MSEAKQRVEERAGRESGRCVTPPHAAVRSWVLLHGAGGGPWECLSWRRRLQARGLQTECPDYSTLAQADASLRFDKLCEKLAGALNAHAGCVLVGASFGGLVAARLATQLQASALILINPLPCLPFVEAPIEAALEQWRPWGREARLGSTRDAIPELHPVDAAFAFRRWRDFGSRLLAQARAGIAVERPECPTLFVLSRSDKELPAAQGAAMALSWGAECLRVPGSHVAPLIGPLAGPCFEHVLAWARHIGTPALAPS